LAKRAPDPPAAVPDEAPKITGSRMPVPKVNPPDATAAALLAFAGEKAAANVPGAAVAVPEAEAVVPLMAQPETPPAPQPVGPL
jgi:hypothetical protein